jgi:hypothetical protein
MTYRASEVLEDFCKPSVCQVCGARIYYVRHNGGSVFFDALGYPWPKHSCYEDDFPEEFYYWMKELSKSRNHPHPGLITEFTAYQLKPISRLVVICERQKMFDIQVPALRDDFDFTREIVILAPKSMKIVHIPSKKYRNMKVPLYRRHRTDFIDPKSQAIKPIQILSLKRL